jgi:hypothetical protein
VFFCSGWTSVHRQVDVLAARGWRCGLNARHPGGLGDGGDEVTQEEESVNILHVSSRPAPTALPGDAFDRVAQSLIGRDQWRRILFYVPLEDRRHLSAGCATDAYRDEETLNFFLSAWRASLAAFLREHLSPAAAVGNDALATANDSAA